MRVQCTSSARRLRARRSCRRTRLWTERKSVSSSASSIGPNPAFASGPELADNAGVPGCGATFATAFAPKVPSKPESTPPRGASASGIDASMASNPKSGVPRPFEVGVMDSCQKPGKQSLGELGQLVIDRFDALANFGIHHDGIEPFRQHFFEQCEELRAIAPGDADEDGRYARRA